MMEIKGAWATRASLFCLLPHLFAATLAGPWNTQKSKKDPFLHLGPSSVAWPISARTVLVQGTLVGWYRTDAL